MGEHILMGTHLCNGILAVDNDLYMCQLVWINAHHSLLYYLAYSNIQQVGYCLTGHIVVIVGDINTSHKEIDHCDPYEVIINIFRLAFSRLKYYLNSKKFWLTFFVGPF